MEEWGRLEGQNPFRLSQMSHKSWQNKNSMSANYMYIHIIIRLCICWDYKVLTHMLF